MVINEFTGETTKEFKGYYRLEIARIKLENFGSLFESYVEDLVLIEYYLETDNTPFIGDQECFHIETFKQGCFEKLMKLDAQ